MYLDIIFCQYRTFLIIIITDFLHVAISKFLSLKEGGAVLPLFRTTHDGIIF